MTGRVHPNFAPPLALRMCRYAKLVRQLLYADRTCVAMPRPTKVVQNLLPRDSHHKGTLNPEIRSFRLRYPASSRSKRGRCLGLRGTCYFLQHSYGSSAQPRSAASNQYSRLSWAGGALVL